MRRPRAWGCTTATAGVLLGAAAVAAALTVGDWVALALAVFLLAALALFGLALHGWPYY